MKFEPNIGKAWRLTYVIIGLALLASPFAVALEGWMRIALPVLGGVSFIAGAVGW